MIVKLKCVDTCGYNYFTKGKEYDGFPSSISSNSYYIKDDESDQCAVSVIKDFHGVWEIVEDDC